MLSVLMVCGNGCGSSLVCQMAVESVLKELGVKQGASKGRSQRYAVGFI